MIESDLNTQYMCVRAYVYSLCYYDFLFSEICPIWTLPPYFQAAGIAQSVQRLAMGWTVRGSYPGGGEIFRTRPEWSYGTPSLLYNGYRVFPGGKAAGAGVDHLPHLSTEVLKRGRAIPLLTIRALVAYKGRTFTFTYHILTLDQPRTATL